MLADTHRDAVVAHEINTMLVEFSTGFKIPVMIFGTNTFGLRIVVAATEKIRYFAKMPSSSFESTTSYDLHNKNKKMNFANKSDNFAVFCNLKRKIKVSF